VKNEKNFSGRRTAIKKPQLMIAFPDWFKKKKLQTRRSEREDLVDW